MNYFKSGKRTPGEKEFHQAVEEVIESVWDFYEKNPRYQKCKNFRNEWLNPNG